MSLKQIEQLSQSDQEFQEQLILLAIQYELDH